ncbi:MAG: hypothetical protein QXI12_02110 [Candidatus Methanomethyliaceae archaeon]
MTGCPYSENNWDKHVKTDCFQVNLKNLFCELLLEWWEKNKRDFPWRHTQDPYAVLVAEMLLRKTNAQQVKRVFSEFLRKYPSPMSLANANEDELTNLLKTLGMEHSRAKLFIRLGSFITERYNGNIPNQAEKLLQLPGVGLYATNAVLCFAFSQDVPTVDTNFIRVIERVFSLKPSRARARNDKKLWEFAHSLLPRGRSREFNFAILDFASIICRSKKPKHALCPIVHVCEFYINTTKSSFGDTIKVTVSLCKQASGLESPLNNRLKEKAQKTRA